MSAGVGEYTGPLISVAPMMDCTDRHDRYFLRLIAPDVVLYTEMITAQALHHGDAEYLLKYNPEEHPLALQLGGSDPVLLAKAAKIGEAAGYDEINLNVGCPSSRVKSGHFGACLMLKPDLVAACVDAMMSAVRTIPITIKCRIGVDDSDSYDALCHFIETVARAGCSTFIIHARKAWLSGLSPRQNREIPPLRYDFVHKIKSDYPGLKVIINGGIQSVADVEAQLPFVDGVMIGRAAYANPFLLAELERHFYPQRQIVAREVIIEKFLPYVRNQIKNSVKLSAISRHILGLYLGQRGAAGWRRYISQHAHLPGADASVIEGALAFVT